MKHLLTVVFITLLTLSTGCGSEPVKPEIDPETRIGVLNIIMDDFKFTPDKVAVDVRQKIRIVLKNNSKKNDHSFSIGYGVIDQDGASKGFKTDLLESVEVTVTGPAKIVKVGNTKLTIDEDVDVEKDSVGFVIVKSPSNEATVIEFIVPDKVGEFEFGSFENDGKDYEDGMKGTLKVFTGDEFNLFAPASTYRGTPTPAK
tara:strand:+ start:106 stop:708 length:603 start_codon:yes stop_codon:yes gene_type:complete